MTSFYTHISMASGVGIPRSCIRMAAQPAAITSTFSFKFFIPFNPFLLRVLLLVNHRRINIFPSCILVLDYGGILSASITVFDGASCIGGNKIYMEFDGSGAFFDFGTNYKKISDFYEEFLSPRPSRGIHDLLYMGIIPNIKLLQAGSRAERCRFIFST